jgi:hypothetical protein
LRGFSTSAPSSSDSFTFTQQGEQQMLGADVVVPKNARFVLREDNNLASGLREAPGG